MFSGSLFLQVTHNSSVNKVVIDVMITSELGSLIYTPVNI